MSLPKPSPFRLFGDKFHSLPIGTSDVTETFACPAAGQSRFEKPFPVFHQHDSSVRYKHHISQKRIEVTSTFKSPSYVLYLWYRLIIPEL